MKTELFKIDSKRFRKDLLYVLEAVSKDNYRPNLWCVYFTDTRMVATDGHRMHVSALPKEIKEPFCISGDSLSGLTKLLQLNSEVFVSCDDEQVYFVGPGEYQVSLYKKDVKFPDIDMVIPEGLPLRVTVDAKELTALVRSAESIDTRGKDKDYLKVVINGCLSIGDDSIPLISSNHTGKDFEIGLNRKYLLAVLKGQRSVDMSFDDNFSAIRINRDQSFAVVMPMRI